MSFNLKKNGSVCAVAAVLFATTWGAHAADPTTDPSMAVVKFKATVTSSTCTPEWNAEGTTVDFKKVSSKSLATMGSVGSAVPFSLSLKDCSDVQGVTVWASGKADRGDGKSFANTDADATAATHVGFRLLGGDKQTLMIPNDINSAVEYVMPSTPDKDKNPVYDTSLTMPFLAQFVATADAATVGPASGQATLYMAYE